MLHIEQEMFVVTKVDLVSVLEELGIVWIIVVQYAKDLLNT